MDWQRVRERVAIDALRWMPKSALTHAIGWASRRTVPRPLRRRVYGGFAHRFGIDLDEVDRPLERFERFDEFFTRPLPDGARVVAPGDEVVVSPCDGVLSEVGLAEAGRLIQAKGRDYTLRGLLADEAEAHAFQGGAYATIYLAPKNYHRVHSPIGGAVTGWRHVPGAFFPVNAPSVRQVKGLFALNERLVTYVKGPAGRAAVVMVAAFGVGHITAAYDEIETHRRPKDGYHRTYPDPRPIAKGGEIGMFHLGSTVVMVFEPGRVTLSGLEKGRVVRMGQALGRLAGGRAGEVIA